MTQFGPQKSVQFSRRAGLLRLQWQPVEEVIGSALAASRAALVGHTVETHVPADLPLVQYDAVLIERVVSNLLENAGNTRRRAAWSPSRPSDAVCGSTAR
jgi:K+-sensing histidine kinase KdpD